MVVSQSLGDRKVSADYPQVMNSFPFYTHPLARFVHRLESTGNSLDIIIKTTWYCNEWLHKYTGSSSQVHQQARLTRHGPDTSSLWTKGLEPAWYERPLQTEDSPPKIKACPQRTHSGRPAGRRVLPTVDTEPPVSTGPTQPRGKIVP